MQLYDVIQSPQDHRLYRRYALANGLQVLLVSDPEISLSNTGVDVDAVRSASGSESGAEDADETDGASSTSQSAGHEHESQGRATYVKQAGAAMAVGVGSLSDPIHLQGLSHYLEHMLFMGSERFPDENEYDAYLVNHGGSANAYTELEHTNYHFGVRPEALLGALDRFAQFFVAPLCKADALEREVQAVDNEFTGVMQHDGSRLAQIRSHTARPGHPYQKFPWGNRKSLWEDPVREGVDIRGDLVEYYRKHYHAEHMTLTVLGGNTLDELQQWVHTLFGGLKRGETPRPDFGAAGLPFQAGSLYITPAVKAGHRITATFQLPCLHPQYTRKPEDYLSHLIGHEGHGSLLSCLKSMGWATGELTAGVMEGGFERSTAAYLFDVTITLTEAGLHAGPGLGLAIIGLLFQYIAMLRHEGLQAWVYEELASVAATKFAFANEEDACDFVSRLAADMQRFNPEHTLNGDSLFESWDAELVRSVLDLLSPDNLRLDLQTSAFQELVSQHSAAQHTEPWFNMPYLHLPIPSECLREWQGTVSACSTSQDAREQFTLPPRNPYIPTDFTLVDEAASGQPEEQHSRGAPAADASRGSGTGGTGSHIGIKRTRELQDQAGEDRPLPTPTLSQPPSLIHDTPGLRVWQRGLDAIRLPKAAAYFSLAGLHLNDSPSTAAGLHLLLKLLRDALCEDAYLADIAGLQYEVSPEGPAFEVQVDGFSHKLPVLVESIFTKLADFRVDEQRFHAVHEALVLQYANANLTPERHAGYLRLRALKRFWDVDAVLHALKQLTAGGLQAMLPHLLSKVHVEALLLGNVPARDAAAMAGAVQRHLKADLPSQQRISQGVVQLPPGCSYLHRAPTKNPQEDNSVAEIYLQIGQDSIAQRACADMLEQVAGEPCYNTLRTQEQLGYSVGCGVRLTHAALGFAFTVVSGAHGPGHLEARIEAFIKGFEDTLDSMPPEEWEQHREALIQAKKQKDASIADEAMRFWEQLASRRYNMHEREQEVEQIQALSQSQLAAWYRQHISAASGMRRKLAVHIVGRPHTAELDRPPHGNEGTHILSDLEAFKDAAHFYAGVDVPVTTPS